MLCVFAKHRNQINVTDVCLLNLAISDLFFTLSMPFFAHTATATGKWIFGAFMCHLVNGLYLMGFYGSALAVVALTLDRYVAIMHPHTLAQHRGFWWGAAATATVWALSTAISLPLIAAVGLRDGSCSFPKEGFAWQDLYTWSINVVGLVIPLLVMVACYSHILPSLMAMRSAKRHRIIRLVIIIIAVYFLFWGPYNIAVFLDFLKGKTGHFAECGAQASLSITIQVTEALAFTHCCLNPIIYAFVGQKFLRRSLKLLRTWVPCAFRWVAPVRTASSTKSSVVSMSLEPTSTFVM